ncbi:MAG: dihydrofolate reductase family protein [Enterovibrio sp.]
MSNKCSVFVAASVDGFIAKSDGGLDWLDRPEYGCEQLNGLSFEEFIADIDALVMGRKTFEKVCSFDSWPYSGVPVVVLSNSNVTVPEYLADLVTIDAGEPSAIVQRLAEKGMTRLYIDGGVTITRFLQQKLVTELTITRIPVLLGSGLPLFAGNFPEQNLVLLEAFVSENGFVQERYKVELLA